VGPGPGRAARSAPARTEVTLTRGGTHARLPASLRSCCSPPASCRSRSCRARHHGAFFAARTGSCARAATSTRTAEARATSSASPTRRTGTRSSPTRASVKDLNLRNRVGDDFPLYFGVNQRFMLLASQQDVAATDPITRTGFWNMQSSFFATFQPTRSSRSSTPRGVEASTNRATPLRCSVGLRRVPEGRSVRVPFGLRMDDHTVATRNSFLDYIANGYRFLPYDPRRWIAVWRSGARAEACSDAPPSRTGPPPTRRRRRPAPSGRGCQARLRHDRHQAAVVLRRLESDGTGEQRAPFALGLLRAREPRPAGVPRRDRGGHGPGVVGGRSAADQPDGGFAELDWSPQRAYNLRFRYDRLELDRSSDDPTRALNSWNRYALEGEWVPVPFAELRWVLRLIDPVAGYDPGGAEIENEKQAYLQLHLSY